MVSTAVDRLDGLSSATAWKGPCRVATTANITLSGPQTIDGVAVVADDRVLVKDQTTASENGIYVVAAGSWRRARDFYGARDVMKGTRVAVTDGSTLAGSEYRISSDNPITVGTSNIAFIASGAVSSVNGQSGIVVLDADDISDTSTTHKFTTAAEITKLAGIATGATANSSNATLLARANHTGTQLAATISDFSTAADARVSAAVGSTVQAYAANLTLWAAVAPSSYLTTAAAAAAYQPLDADLTALAGIGVAVSGDVIYASGAGTWARLAKGTNGHFLTLTAGVPAWVAVPGGGDMLAASYPTLVSLEGLSLVAGDLLYVTAADTLARLAKGTALQVLQMNSGATAPEWVSINGKQSLWIPAGAMIKRTTNGAADGSVEMTTNKNMFKTLDFDTTTQEFAQFSIRMPKSWDEGTVTFIPVWSHAATTTNFGVTFGLAGVAISNDDAGDAAFGTAVTSVDIGGTTNDIYQGPESSAITIAGTPAEGDLVMFQVNRTVADAGDTMAIDARLHGVLVLYTTNVLTDS